jgi:hypothetical protein
VVLECSNDQDHADGMVNVANASGNAFDGDSNVTRFNGSHTSHGVAQVANQSQVASQGADVVNVHNADMATE